MELRLPNHIMDTVNYKGEYWDSATGSAIKRIDGPCRTQCCDMGVVDIREAMGICLLHVDVDDRVLDPKSNRV